MGIFLTNLDIAPTYNAPPTNITVENDTIRDPNVTNGYVYQAGIPGDTP